MELPVRMGLAAGEAELRDGDYFGAVLNRAARAMAAGHGGHLLYLSMESPRERGPPMPDRALLYARISVDKTGEEVGVTCRGMRNTERIADTLAPGLWRNG